MSTRLFRSRDDRMLAGVAGGLAELWDADPSLVRLIWALLVIPTGGIAFVVYIVLAIVVPEEDEGVGPWAPGGMPIAAPTITDGPTTTDPASHPASAFASPAPSMPADARAAARQARHDARAARRARHGHDGRTGGVLIGGLLVLIGAWLLVREYLPTFDADWVWPLALVGVGAVLLILAIRPSGAGGSSDGTAR